MADLNVQAIQPSVLEDTYNNIGEGFQEIMDDLQKINEGGNTISLQDTLALQQSVFHYSMYQETVTKIASKSATAINDVMKAQ
ncbi:EscI/YscI/HrpB family type III secretion system inner rod protein [Shewanella psychropiezotolerans]|uniref:Type III secretion apparatus protein, YscI/HrpB, C-terminal domain n=2 Tax=Shewanella TaxID=22 RepID=A0A1S6HQ56_9GAMM|nr:MULTISPECIES: type III secretion system inner rod subunit SctI [Shewanella]AQS37667.1 type III secretion apparatus protein, YscI/HrpB, C-terminal domain [Shewanella psychrophila]MPY23352.1 EscI/YscI/HrpB family type III secretion system inner rod protein [Shewanella sp. YLB-07]QDO85439.1 EscI/YscI/HrpB family type III secretion system inner rod protein [Shewanella psychropiezotolerans]